MGHAVIRYVVTANALDDGGVRWLARAGDALSWTTKGSEAALAPDEATRDGWLAAAQADVKRCLVVAPYAVEVEVEAEGETFRHLSVKERIRAAGGPTVGNGVHAEGA
jgi:hypothetical protein